MPDRSLPPSHGVCPHVDRDDPRCASRLNLGRLDQAYSVCFGAFHLCPMYHRIGAEDRAARSSPQPLVETLRTTPLTCHGQPLPLRATGS